MKKQKFWDPHWDISIIAICITIGTVYSFVFSPSDYGGQLMKFFGVGLVLSGVYTIAKKRISKLGYAGNYAYSRSAAFIQGITYIIGGLILFKLMI